MNKCVLSAILVALISATAPEDICESCVHLSKCPVFASMASAEQQAWMRKYPCNNHHPDDYGTPPGSKATAASFICCPNQIWGLTPKEGSSSQYTETRFGSTQGQPGSVDQSQYSSFFSSYSKNTGNNEDNDANKQRDLGQSTLTPSIEPSRWGMPSRNRYWNARPDENRWDIGNQNFYHGNDNNRFPNNRRNHYDYDGRGREDYYNQGRYQPGSRGIDRDDYDYQNYPYNTGGRGSEDQVNRGRSGDQGIRGGPGDQGIRGGPGDQGIRRGPGDQGVRGGSGDQGVRGGPGDQGIRGGPMDQGIGRGSGNQGVWGGPGDQGIRGGSGDQGIRGGSGDQGGTGNSFGQAGQCDRLTSFPPDPRSGCCGREASDDDRITDTQPPAYYDYDTPSYNNRGRQREEPPSYDYYMFKEESTNTVTVNNNKVTAVNGSAVAIENRISGGKETELTQYPWTALLLSMFENGLQQTAFNCGGSLLSARYVLTAGHCVYDAESVLKGVQVFLAEYDKRTFPRDCKITAEGRKCIENLAIDSETVILHPRFDEKRLQNDIALVKLKADAPYTDYIRPICLPSINIDNPEHARLTLTVAGWGRNGQYKTDIKQSTTVHLVPQHDCKKFYPDLTRRHLCAAGYSGEDSCKGDSGGPLMVLYRDRYYVVGVVSGKRTDAPCGSTVPSLYTNVYHYLEWIRINIAS